MPRGTWGPYRMGFVGAYNTIEANVGAYNTVCATTVVEYCSNRHTGHGHGLTCAPWLAFSVRLLVLSEPMSRSESSSRLWSRQSEKSGVQGPYEPRSEGRGVGVRSSALGQAFRSERTSRGGWSPNRALRLDRWAEVAGRVGVALLGLGLPIYFWTAPLPCCF